MMAYYCSIKASGAQAGPFRFSVRFERRSRMREYLRVKLNCLLVLLFDESSVCAGSEGVCRTSRHRCTIHHAALNGGRPWFAIYKAASRRCLRPSGMSKVSRTERDSVTCSLSPKLMLEPQSARTKNGELTFELPQLQGASYLPILCPASLFITECTL